MSDVRAVVFDFDGTIIDTETSIFTAWEEVFVAHDVDPLTRHEWAAQVGTVAGIDVVGVLRERAGFVDDVIVEARHVRRRELLVGESIRAGVLDWLDELDARRIPRAIASSSASDWVDEHLDRFGLRDRFGPVCCRGNGLAPKPAPDLYVAACAALDVAPAAALAIEDSPHGVAAAKGAGLRCVAVPNAVTAPLDFSGADLVADSLADVSLADVVARLR